MGALESPPVLFWLGFMRNGSLCWSGGVLQGNKKKTERFVVWQMDGWILVNIHQFDKVMPFSLTLCFKVSEKIRNKIKRLWPEAEERSMKTNIKVFAQCC